MAGLVTIGYYGPFFLNDQELSFINSLNTLLLWVTLAALALAVAVRASHGAAASPCPSRASRSRRRRSPRATGTCASPSTTRVREIDGIATAVNDLSRALREQEALRRRLTADMAHELRTPLATLQSHLEALIDGVWQPDPQRLAGLHEEILRHQPARRGPGEPRPVRE